MSYQVLARKWRPRDFTTLVGQEHVVRALTHALEQQRLHHAYLFTGTRGVGKTTLSRILAKSLNCIGPDGSGGITAQPCGVCQACTEIDSGRFVDYIEMDAASNRGVDEMAQLLDKAIYAPTSGRFKVYMIDEVHMLTNHAFNAMLKTLEEPPGHVKFILATTDPQKIPVTVLSRCLQFNLKQMPPGHIVGHLERVLGEEGIGHDANALRLLAQAAQGSMRDALSLTDQAIAYSAGQVSEEAVRGMLGSIDQSYLVQLLDALVAEDGAAVLGVAGNMADRSLSFAGALQDLASLLHKVALAQAVPASVQDEWPEAADVRRLADALDPQEVQLYYQIANLGRHELALAPDEYAGFTMTLLRMLAFRPSATPDPMPGIGGAGQAQGAGKGGSANIRPRATVVAEPSAMAMASTPGPAVGSAASGAVSRASSPVATQPVRSAAPPAARPAAPSAPQASGKPAAHTAAQLAPESASQASVQAVKATPPAQPVPPAAQPETPASPALRQPVAPSSSPAAASSDAMSPARAALAAARQGSAGRVSGGRPSPMASATGPAQAPVAPRSAPPVQPLRPPASAPASAPVRRNVPAQDTAPVQPVRESAPARTPARASASAAPQADDMPPWEMAGVSDIPPWEEMPPGLADFGSFDSLPSTPPTTAGARPAPMQAARDNGRRQEDLVRESRGVQGRQPGAAPARAESPAVPEAARPTGPVTASAAPAADADGTPPVFTGAWPALAASLPLKGLAQQLVYQSELVRVVGRNILLRAPVAAIAEAGMVERLQQVLTEHFGGPVRIQCELGPVVETAAAADAQMRAQRQREAEEAVGRDPFVQGLLREFGGHIVPGSIQPRAA